MSELKDNYPVIIQFPVHWGEMDAFNHINNVAYFRYFESARIAYFEAISMMEDMKKEKIGPILASTECRYKRAVTYPDKIHVGANIRHLSENDFWMYYAIYSDQQKCITTEGKARVVMVSYETGEKVPVSERLREQIARLEQGRETG